MGSVLKGNRYRLVDNRAFDLPPSVKYVLLKEDNEIAEYEVVDNEKVSCRIITKYKENMITPIHRPLTIADIHYFMSARVFQDRTPFTEAELALLGLEKYNVYDIIRKTRGVTPYDDYWVKFDGDKCDFQKAKADWNDLMSKVAAPSADTPSEAPAPQSGADISEILNQHKVDVASKISEGAAQQPAPEKTAAAEKPAAPEKTSVESNTMSEAEIEALLMKSGLSEPTDDVFREIASEDEAKPSEPSGGKMSQDDIEKMLAAAAVPEPAPAPVEEPKPSGGKTSQDDIEKMLAAAAAPEPAPAPVEEPKPSGGKMSQDDIEKMLAAAAAPEPAPAPAEEPKPSGGKMSQDDIEKMLAAAAAPEPAPAPVEEPKPSGGKMSQDDIEKMLAATAAPEPAPAEEPKPSGGKMSQDDIEKMLAATAAPEPAPAPAPVEEPKPSGGKMSQDDIEKMLAATAAPEPAPAPVEEPKPSGGKMSQDDIEKMLAAASEAVQEPILSEPEPVQETLADSVAVSAPSAPAASQDEPKPSGGKMSQADIEALLSGMKDDVK